MIRKNKKTVIVLLLIVFLLIISPLQSASGQEEQTDIIGSAVSFFGSAVMLSLCPPCFTFQQIFGNLGLAQPIFDGVIRVVTAWAGAVSSIFLNASQSLLNWVISDSFMGMSMTGPDNPFVSYGWGIVRNLANIFLLLGLIIIGLGIILGLEEYQAKKTLPRLITIAILINFTPVICGFVIDFSNILMHYFLTGGLSSGLTNTVQEGLSRAASLNKDPIPLLAVVSVYFIFSVVGSLTYLLYALLFAGRYMFLWILIIFSPIAFVSHVFPQSSYVKHFFPEFFFWDTWWDKFLQWCVIGIYGGFFVFLANQLMGAIATNKLTSEPTGAVASFGNLFGYFLPILLLLIGFFSAKEAGKKGMEAIPGMKQVIEPIMGLGKMAAMAAITGGVGLAAGAAAGATVGASKGLQAGTGAGGKLMGGLKGLAEGAVRGEGREEGVKWYKKQAEKVPFIGPKPGTYEAELRGKTSEEEKRLGKLPEKDLNYLASERTVLTREGRIRRAAALNVLSSRGKLTAENTKYAKESEAFGFDTGEALKRAPNLYSNLGKNKEDADKSIHKQAPADFAKNIQASAINEDVLAEMSLEQLRILGNKGSTDKVNKIKELKMPTPANIALFAKKWTELHAAKSKATTPEEIAEADRKIDNFNKILLEMKSNPNFQ